MVAFDCGCYSTTMAESFYYLNVAPQVPALNRGNWKRLENYTRKLVKDYDSILARFGSLMYEKRCIGWVAIQDYCWKIVYVKISNRIFQE